jgi:hypothetical protein
LVALAGASAAIAGGILAASSATAESMKPALGQAALVAASTVVTVPAAPAPVLAETTTPTGLQADGMFVGTEDEFAAHLRAQMFSPVDLDDISTRAVSTPRQGIVAVGPDPCNSCDPEDVTNTASPNYDPDVLAVYQEDDFLAPPDGPGVGPGGDGLTTCNDLAVDGPFWMGANDHCAGPIGAAGRNPAYTDTQIPAFTTLGQKYAICGQIGLVNTTGFLGSPNVPGDPPTEPLNGQEQDLWEFELVTGLDIRVEGFMESANMQMILVFNLDTALELGTFDQFRNCNDRYGISNAWDSTGFVINTACSEEGEWSEFLSPGYYYMFVDPLAALGAGTPGAQLCEFWYNLTISSFDPEGACCIGDNCSDNVLKTACWGLGGVFRGSGTDCSSSVCCDVLGELAGEGLAADYEEGDIVANPQTERRCNVVGSLDSNPGCQRDNEGDPIPGVPDAGEPVVDSNLDPLDYCADPDKFVVVGYAGTPDDFEASFLNSQFFAFHDGDAFVFTNNSGSSQLVEIDGFAAATGVFQYQVRAGSSPDGGIFGYSCDVSGFVGGITPPCQRIAIADCLAEGTWSMGFRGFDAAGISCDTPYWFSIECGACAPVACCLPNGTCVDAADSNVCNDFLSETSFGGVPGADWSSCCYATCPDACGQAAIPSGSVADDDCSTVNPNVGDIFNSGCDAPDGNPLGKFSTVGFPAAQSWCGSTGTFVDLTGSQPDLGTETDYYIIDLTGASNDIGVTFTISTHSGIAFNIIPGRGEGDCPNNSVDGTDDVRELPDTTTFNLAGGATSVVNFCLEGGVEHMLMFEINAIVECGTPYQVDIEYLTDGCFAACCNTASGCQLVADVANTLTNEQLNACTGLRGIFRGANTRCTGPEAVDCCTVVQDGGDIVDADHPACPTANNLDLNRGCITGGAPGGGFQALGSFAPGSGPTAGTTVSVYGSVCRTTGGLNPPSDSDFYSLSVPAGPDVEYLLTMESNARVNVFAFNAADLGLPGSCNITNPAREVLFNSTGPCNGGATVVASGFSGEGNTFCMIGGADNYILVQPNDPNDGNEARYRMTLTAYECRIGACCIDAALCIDQVGFLECELLNGGQFVDGASCSNQAAGLNLCQGVCCVDDAPNAPICNPNTTAYDCCVTLNGGSFTGDASFAGYSVGDLINDIDCTNNPDICEEGACCVDSIAGYTCQDNLSATQCSGLGGVFQGTGSDCASVTCPSGACCVGPACVEPSSPAACANAGGIYQGDGSDCGTVVCEQTGACCFSCAGGAPTAPCPDPSGPAQGCVILSSAACTAAGGLYVGNNSTCSQGVGGPCDCAGDINNDGNCNAADFTILAGSFGQGTPNCRTHAQGDLNCDGIVNAADFTILAGNFGCIRN